MEPFETSRYSFEFFDHYAVLRLKEIVEELDYDLLLEGMSRLKEFYHEPFGVIYIRKYRESIDLISGRDLIQNYVPKLVAIANVTTEPSTLKMVEFEKTVVDIIPVESFAEKDEAIRWISKIVAEARKETENQS